MDNIFKGIAYISLFLGSLLVLVIVGIIGYISFQSIRISMVYEPSDSISKPMANAIVNKINKRGSYKNVVKFDSLK